MIEKYLTPNPIKTKIFQTDTNFLTSMAVASGFWTSSDRLLDALWNNAALLLRPDAIVGGRCSTILPVLREHGFIPSVVREVSLSIPQTRALWRYQSNVATSERLALLDLLMTTGPSIYIVLHDTRFRLMAPGTVHLTYLKGTAIVDNRKPGHLRTVAGPRIANLLSYVHVSDDPADMLREMSVLFDQRAIHNIVGELDKKEDRTDEALNLITKLSRDVPIDALTRGALELTGDSDGADAMREESPNILEARRRWNQIVKFARTCKSFHGGETYQGKEAIIPDDKWLSLPLDSHLIFTELGPRW